MSKGFTLKRAALASAIAAAFALPASADTARMGTTADARSAAHAQMKERQQAHLQRDDVRLSRLIGKEVVDRQGDKIGKVSDAVIDVNEGRVQYVVIERSGDAEGLVALPARALQSSDKDGQVKLDIDRQAFQEMRTVESDRLPGMADAAYWRDVQTRFGDAAGIAQQDQRELRRGSEILKTDIVSRAGEHLGELRDIVINLDNGNVHYAVLEFEDNPWLPEQLVAVPADALERSVGRDALMLNLSAQDVAAAPSFDEDQWPQIADTGFQQSMDQVRTLIVILTPTGQQDMARRDGEVIGMEQRQDITGVQGRSPLQDPGVRQQQFDREQEGQLQGYRRLGREDFDQQRQADILGQERTDSLAQQQERAREQAQQHLRDRDPQANQQRVERAAQQDRMVEGAQPAPTDMRIAQPGPVPQVGQPDAQAAPTPTIDARPFTDESFKRLDRDGDGRISRDEAQLDPTFFAVWNQLDADNSGYVTLQDVQAFRQKRGLQ